MRVLNKHARGRWEWAGTRPRVLSSPLAKLCHACERELDFKGICPRCAAKRQEKLMEGCKLRGYGRHGWWLFVSGGAQPRSEPVMFGRRVMGAGRAVWKGWHAARRFHEVASMAT